MLYQLKIRYMLVMFIVHGEQRQLIMQRCSSYKGVAYIRIVAKNIFLYQVSKDV